MDLTTRTSRTPEITSLVHDLRNPLSSIQLSAEVLANSRLSRLQIRQIARNLYGASVQMKELIEEVLTAHKESTRGAEACNLSELVTGVVGKIALAAEAQAVQIVQNVPGNLLITVDRQRIQRVLVNLLVNGLEVMPDGGTIRVSAVLEHHSVLIKVRDTGPGVAPEIRHRLFQPFATAGKVGGLGLGLFFSRQAVLDHGGQMWVESGNQGACFAFCLPAILDAHGLMLKHPGREPAGWVELSTVTS